MCPHETDRNSRVKYRLKKELSIGYQACPRPDNPGETIHPPLPRLRYDRQAHGLQLSSIFSRSDDSAAGG